MDYMFERSAKKSQNEEIRQLNEIRNSFLNLSECSYFMHYVQCKNMCFNCMKIIDSSETHRCINNLVILKI